MRRRLLLPVAAVLVGALASAGPMSLASAAALPQQLPSDCASIQRGASSAGTPWAQTRLGVDQVRPLTRGAGVRVAVIDSGFDYRQVQLRGIKIDDPINVTSATASTDVTDCVGHGTGVIGLIAGQPVAGSLFAGIAPAATIIPIKETDSAENQKTPISALVRGIYAAIAARAQVVNISLVGTVGTAPLRQAIAAAAQAGIVVVAASGNDGASSNQVSYPAAYASEFTNVIAVGATDDHDVVADFSTRGSYVSVCAPGVNLAMPARLVGYQTQQQGTSFATPLVTGTVALMLAAHPTMTPAQVRARLEMTADAPPATVPSPEYGYGIINPYLAVTAVTDPAAAAQPSPVRSSVPAQAAPARPDRHLQHTAQIAALALLALTIAMAVGAVVVRRTRAIGRQSAAGVGR